MKKILGIIISIIAGLGIGVGSFFLLSNTGVWNGAFEVFMNYAYNALVHVGIVLGFLAYIPIAYIGLTYTGEQIIDGEYEVLGIDAAGVMVLLYFFDLLKKWFLSSYSFPVSHMGTAVFVCQIVTAVLIGAVIMSIGLITNKAVNRY